MIIEKTIGKKLVNLIGFLNWTEVQIKDRTVFLSPDVKSLHVVVLDGDWGGHELYDYPDVFEYLLDWREEEEEIKLFNVNLEEIAEVVADKMDGQGWLEDWDEVKDKQTFIDDILLSDGHGKLVETDSKLSIA